MIKILLHYPVGIFNPKCFNSIMKLDFSNTQTDIFVDIYNKIDPLYNNDGIEKDSKWRMSIAEKMNRMRNIVIKEKYDYALNIEHDLIVPENGLQVLLSYVTNDNIVGGLYRLRKKRNINAPLCCLKIDSTKIDGNGGWPEKEDFEGKEKVPVYLLPFGFSLFSRKVLERLPIFDTDLDGSVSAFCYKNAIQQLIIPSIFLQHVDRDGQVYIV